MLISNILGLGPGVSGRSRRGYAFAAALTAAVYAGAVPAAAEGAPHTAAGGSGVAERPAHPVVAPASPSGPPVDTTAVGPDRGEVIGSRLPGAPEPLAPGGARTLVPAVIGGAVGLALFAAGGVLAAARGRGGRGGRQHG
ncbi:hypothetical protein [Streptomyces sp. NPDC048462]|uniref:hypothetical protein n=1 Tax=Streptomyces sp. NPDC048462 TaxID=3365555 RepID=UPI0037128F14